MTNIAAHTKAKTMKPKVEKPVKATKPTKAKAAKKPVKKKLEVIENPLKFLNAESITSLEEYATSMLVGMISLRTLEAAHRKAISIGILSGDLEEASKRISWEMSRVAQLYLEQLADIQELIELDMDAVTASLHSLMKK